MNKSKKKVLESVNWLRCCLEDDELGEATSALLEIAVYIYGICFRGESKEEKTEVEE